MLILSNIARKEGSVESVIDLIEKGKVKRYFRTRDKYSFEGAVTHVTQHASGTEPLFLEETDYLYMLGLIKEVCARFKLTVFSFALMLNHIHLLVRMGASNLADAMQILFQTYANYFNKKYERKGHAFSGAYRSSLCFDDAYLLASSLYIHFNPVKAEIVENAIDYRWSSCALFLSGNEIDSFVDYRFVLNLFNSDLPKASQEYGMLLHKLKKEETGNIFEQPKALESIVRMIKERGLCGNDDLEKNIRILREEKYLRAPQKIEARRFAIAQLKARGYSIPEIADRLNLSRQTVYSALNWTK